MTTERKHHKHPAVKKPSLGRFSRNEIAIMGTDCARIRAIALKIIEVLGNKYRIAYVDTDHKAFDSNLMTATLAAGAVADYSDLIHFRQRHSAEPKNQVEWQIELSSADLVLVNGNHHEANSQIIIADPLKAESLRKRQDRLTDVIACIGERDQLPDFLFEQNTISEDSSIFPLPDFESGKFIQWLDQRLSVKRPALQGLVLAGGQSSRMGFDKGGIELQGKEQRVRMAELIGPFCDSVYLSCRADQLSEIRGPYQLLPDTYTELGPYGAILSAFRKDPDSAWLVVAVDLPLLSPEAIGLLVERRHTKGHATAFYNPETGFPDPLCTIWEPRSYTRMLQFLSLGHSCPRKVLLNSDTRVIEAADPMVLTNMNTPDELSFVRQMLDDNS